MSSLLHSFLARLITACVDLCIVHVLSTALHWMRLCCRFEMVENGIRAVGTVCVCLVANPRFTAVLPVLCFVFWRIHSFTKMGFLEADRLRESLYSPIMSHFGESLRGCVTIRAFNDSERFTLKSHQHMDKKEAAVWAEEHMRMWLDVRMQCGVATPLIAMSSLLAILGRNTASNFSVAAAGLAACLTAQDTQEEPTKLRVGGQGACDPRFNLMSQDLLACLRLPAVGSKA